MDFQGHHAIITGGALGIGQATAELFAKRGARVSILDVDESAGQKAAKSIGAQAAFFRCDVAKPSDMEDAVRAAIKAHGDVSCLINNVGIVRYGTVVDLTLEDWEATINVNLRSAFLAAKHAIPSMQRLGRGVVINVASVQAFLSQAKVAAYTASKSALLGLTRSIAVDFAPQIRCVAVCPGTVDTPMLRNAVAQSPDPAAVLRECDDMHPMRRIAQPGEVAELIAYLCSDAAGFITGQTFRIDGGLGITIGGSKRDS